MSATGDVSRRIRDGYEALPYEGGPHHGGHVDSLATVAYLSGLEPVDVGRARVLELGCATGGNLLPMALGLPGSEFVGVDLSPRQIEAARRTADAVGLRNVRLIAADLTELTADLGPFDYIVCHGLYSWVPEAVRRRILSLCRELLAPRGVAMVSFNAYPGSQTRDSVRALLRFALEKVLAPESDPVEASRALLRIVPRGFEGAGGAFVAQFRRVASIVADEPGYYLGHEFLAEVNQPFFLWEVVEAAEAAGLRFLGDAWTHPDTEGLPPAARDLIDKLSPDRVAREQWLDMLQDRTFRRALLVPAEAEPSEGLLPERVRGLRASAGPGPVQDQEGDGVSTNVPVLQAAFRVLHRAWPRSIPVDDLWRRARDEAVAAGAPADAPDDADFFAGSLLRCYVRHVVGLHTGAFPVVARPGERPRASPLARHQAADGSGVTNLLHQHVELTPFGRSLLPLLDGSRNRTALVRELSGEAAAEEGRAGEETLEERVERSLAKAAREGLLMASPGAPGGVAEGPPP